MKRLLLLSLLLFLAIGVDAQESSPPLVNIRGQQLKFDLVLKMPVDSALVWIDENKKDTYIYLGRSNQITVENTVINVDGKYLFFRRCRANKTPKKKNE